MDIASRLKLVRLARGVTLDALSGAMGRMVTKQALSKYETGQDMPSARVLVRLAEALGVTSERLLSEPACDVQVVAYRSLKALGARERERLESALTYHLEEVVGLRDLVQPGSSVDVPVRALAAETPEEAEACASALRGRWDLGAAPLANVIDALEEHGVAVYLTEADAAFDGLSAIAQRSDGTFCGAAVLSRHGLTHVRQRLSVAHELGHVVLRGADGVDEEPLAWRFAGAFLAPGTTLLEDVGTSRRSISIEELTMLKARYGMSIQALLMRLRDLHVLSAEATRRAFVEISRLGYRRQEPGDYPANESPQWFGRTVVRGVSEGLISAARAGQLLGVPVRSTEGRNQFVHLLAAMSPEEREALLTPCADEPLEKDVEWLEANIQPEGLSN